MDGICVCDHNGGWTQVCSNIAPTSRHTLALQIYGRCFDATTAVFHDLDNDIKFRKPVRPDWCTCLTTKGAGKDKKTEPEKFFICEEHYHKEECQPAPDLFDHNAQFCKPGDHSECHTKVSFDAELF